MSRFSKWLDGETIGWHDIVVCAGIGTMAGLVLMFCGVICFLWMGGNDW